MRYREKQPAALIVGAKTPAGMVRGDSCVNCNHGMPLMGGVWCCTLEERLPPVGDKKAEEAWVHEHRVNEGCWCPNFEREFTFMVVHDTPAQ